MKRTHTKSTTVTARIPQKLKKQLRLIAKDRKRTLSQEIGVALSDHAFGVYDQAWSRFLANEINQEKSHGEN